MKMYQEIDGSIGEGGGQILRTSLAMSSLLNKPICIKNIRSGRQKPGLQAQHLTCVNSLAKITDAEVHGAFIGSQELLFLPNSLKAGEYKFDVSEVKSSAGSATLVFQSILLPLAFAEGESKITILGGTHVPWSPPFQYLQMVYLPTIKKMGIKASISIKNWGWYPKGGGEISVEISNSNIDGINLSERGSLDSINVISSVSNLPLSIAQRQRDQALKILKSEGINAKSELIDAPSIGQGTIVFIFAKFGNGYAGFDTLGAKGKRAEQVAEEACGNCIEFIKSGMSVDPHLADQLVPLMALAKGKSCFSTSRISLHLLTNIQVAEAFLPVKFLVSGNENQHGQVSVEGIGFSR